MPIIQKEQRVLYLQTPATAADDDGTIIKVEFYNGSTLLGTSLTAPFNYTWTNAPQGSYVIKAKAYDNLGFSTFSAPVNVTVNPDTLGPNLCLSKPASASTGTASFAVDGNMGTRWESTFADPQWLTVDLGANYNINSVNISWETAMASAYQLQLSTDSVNWNVLQDVPNNTSTTNNFTGLSGSGRYLRMMGTQRATIYGYSIWEMKAYGVITTGIPLAIGITDLQALAGNHQITVQWNAPDEKDIKDYTVEKSENGMVFKQMNSVAAANKQATQHYAAIDFNPVAGTNFYRIKITRHSGAVQYSAVVKANGIGTSTASFTVYPNPVKDKKVTLDMGSNEPGNYNVSVYNVTGNKVWQQTIQVEKATTTQTLALPKTLTAGTYYFILEDGNNNKQQQKIVLE